MVLEDKVDFIERIWDNRKNYCIHEKPFDASREMIDKTYDLVKYLKGNDFSELNVARTLFKWVHLNIEYEFYNCDGNAKRRPYYVKSASESFEAKAGKCLDGGFVYSTMARIANLESGISVVYVDYMGNGKDVNCEGHACSWVKINGNTHLVDVTTDVGFCIKHKKIEMLDEDQSKELYYVQKRLFKGDAPIVQEVATRKNSSDFLAYLFIGAMFIGMASKANSCDGPSTINNLRHKIIDVIHR